jgi:membrane protease subunit HflK
VNIVRLNLDRADPPEQVIDAFREVQAAEQERDRLERQADAYANRVLAGARGEAAQLLEEAEATAPRWSTRPRVRRAASSPFFRNTNRRRT